MTTFHNSKPIPGFPGYSLTDDFQIIGKKGLALKFSSTQSGYKFVATYVNKKVRCLYLHRAVGLVHLDGYFDGAEIDHIDRNKHNNHPSNLRWVTRHENMNNTHRCIEVVVDGVTYPSVKNASRATGKDWCFIRAHCTTPINKSINQLHSDE